MSLGISIEDAIVLAIEIPGYMFHASMAIFVGNQIYHKTRIFESAFFTLFFCICCIDIIYFLLCSVINIKLPQFGLWTDFFVYGSQGWVSTIGYMTGEYCGIFQAFAHFVISLNRFNVFYFPHSFKKNWHGFRFHTILGSLFVIPLCFILWHSNHKILYSYVTPTSIAQAFDDPSIQLAVGIGGLVIFCTTSILELILGAVTLAKYYKLKKIGKISAQQKAAVILFVHSLCLTAAQLLRTVFFSGIITSVLTNNPALAGFLQKRLPFIADIYALTGSIFLFLISSQIRKSYLHFYSTRLHIFPKRFRRVSASTLPRRFSTKLVTVSQRDTVM